jgi:hypothetical protein
MKTFTRTNVAAGVLVANHQNTSFIITRGPMQSSVRKETSFLVVYLGSPRGKQSNSIDIIWKVGKRNRKFL